MPSGPLFQVLSERPKWPASSSTFVIFSPSILDSISNHRHVFSKAASCQDGNLSLQPEVARPSFLPSLNLLPLQATDSGQSAGQALVCFCRPSHTASSILGGGGLIHPPAEQVVLEQTAPFPSLYLAQGTIKRPLVGFEDGIKSGVTWSGMVVLELVAH